MKKTIGGANQKTTTASAKTVAPRNRAFHLVYDQAVRATLEGGQRKEINDLLAGAKRLKAEYGDLDSLISTLECAAQKAR